MKKCFFFVRYVKYLGIVVGRVESPEGVLGIRNRQFFPNFIFSLVFAMDANEITGADKVTADTICADSYESGYFIIKPPGYAYTVAGVNYRKIPILPNEFVPNDDSSYFNLGI
jgi:hypothetical protein